MGVACLATGVATQWHARSSQQHRELALIRQCSGDPSSPTASLDVFLADEVSRDGTTGLLDFSGDGLSPATISKFGVQFERTYLLDSSLVYVYDTSPELANHLRRLKNIRQIVVWDGYTKDALSKWKNWFPEAVVVAPQDLGYDQDLD